MEKGHKMEEQDQMQEILWNEPSLWLEEADGRSILASETDETAHTCLFSHSGMCPANLISLITSVHAACSTCRLEKRNTQLPELSYLYHQLS